MAVNINMLITALAILTMLYALWQVFSLKRYIPGGMLGKNWKLLASLVVLFAAGYVAMPFIGTLSPDALQLIVAIIFLFGALYVVITIALIRRIILTLTE